MKLHIFKKITSPVEILRKISFGITLSCLAIFLFGLLSPFNQSLAQDATTPTVGSLSTDQGTLNNGSSAKITATITDQYASQIPDGYIIKFSSSSSSATSPYGFNETSAQTATCVIKSKSCYVSFGASGVSDSQTFHVNASIYANSTDNTPLAVQITGVDVIVKNPNAVVVTTPNTTVNTNTTYTPLAPLPGELDANGKPIPVQTDPGCTTNASGVQTCTNPCPFGNYLNIMIKVVIGFAAVLAMVMIVIGGIEYMTTELVSGKEAGRERITNAILGLLIALGAYLILNTINPQLLSACLDNLPQASITIYPYSNSAVQKPASDSVRCAVQTSGSCATSALSAFGNNAENASKVCNVESSSNASLVSGVDKCVDGTPFSFGLFQINVVANGGIGGSVPSSCVGLFVLNSNPNTVISSATKYINNAGYLYDCKLNPNPPSGSSYNSCKSSLLNATTNIAIATQLYNAHGFSPWKGSDYGVCPSAFQ